MQRHLILALAGAVSLALSACGGDTGPEVTQGGTVQTTPTDGSTGGATDSTGAGGGASAGGGANNGAGNQAAGTTGTTGAAAAAASEASHDRYPAAQRTCLDEVARVSGSPAAELVVTGTARTQSGVEVRVQRQELSSAWTCQTDAQGGTVLGVQDGREP